MLFYNKLAKGVCKQMGATRSEAVSASWSPCGRYVLASTTAPRLRVDNGVKVFSYIGAAGRGVHFRVFLGGQQAEGVEGGGADGCPAAPCTHMHPHSPRPPTHP
jgi:translation initiation factor 2A